MLVGSIFPHCGRINQYQYMNDDDDKLEFEFKSDLSSGDIQTLEHSAVLSNSL